MYNLEIRRDRNDVRELDFEFLDQCSNALYIWVTMARACSQGPKLGARMDASNATGRDTSNSAPVWSLILWDMLLS
jgi:hypothetical protein